MVGYFAYQSKLLHKDCTSAPVLAGHCKTQPDQGAKLHNMESHMSAAVLAGHFEHVIEGGHSNEHAANLIVKSGRSEHVATCSGTQPHIMEKLHVSTSACGTLHEFVATGPGHKTMQHADLASNSFCKTLQQWCLQKQWCLHDTISMCCILCSLPYFAQD